MPRGHDQDDNCTVTRTEAIQYVINTAHGAHTEFCVGEDKCKEECKATLVALGVSEDELNGAHWWKQW